MVSNKWICSKCHVGNQNMAATKCVWCNAPRPKASQINKIKEDVDHTNQNLKNIIAVLIRELTLNEKKQLVLEMKRRWPGYL